MDILKELIEKRIKAIEADIVAGTFDSEDSLENELARLSNVMIGSAVIAGMKKKEAVSYIAENFSRKVRKYYAEMNKKVSSPEIYHFASREDAIINFIADGKLKEAREEIAAVMELIDDEEIVNASLAEGIFTQEDIECFKRNAKDFEEEIAAAESTNELKEDESSLEPETENEKENIPLLERIKFVFTGKNPYENQTVTLQKEKVSHSKKEKKANKNWTKAALEIGKKHKGKIALAATAALIAVTIKIGAHLNSNGRLNIAEDSTSKTDIDKDSKSIKFGVDEYHNFNMNDEQTHIEKLQLSAQYFMEHGVLVASEEECAKIRKENEGILVVSPEELNNWLIVMNNEDINGLTFTKLLSETNTSREELMSDYFRVNDILSQIYTTKIDNPFIYNLISNKEYSNYVRTYEEAVIQNQKGNSADLIHLINGRINEPAAKTYGPFGLLTTTMIYNQKNVFNKNVLGIDVLKQYGYDGSASYGCVDDGHYYATDYAKMTLALKDKFDIMITYTGSEVEAYNRYLITLSDQQDDNKTYIENQILSYLVSQNISLGRFEVIDTIANAYDNFNEKKENSSQSVGTTTGQTTQKDTNTTVKEPTTSSETAVKEEDEKKFDEQNRESFNDTVESFVKENNGVVLEGKENGDVVIKIPGMADTVIDNETLGAYDPTKDIPKDTWYADTTNRGEAYQKYKEEVIQNGSSNLSNTSGSASVVYVDGIGEVVVLPDQSQTIVVNPNVHKGPSGNLYDNNGNAILAGDEETIDDYIERHPGVGNSVITKEEIIYPDGTKYTITNGSSSNNNNSYNSSGSNSSSGSNNSNNSSTSVPPGVDKDVYDSLTAEEKEQLLDYLYGWQGPVAGEVVDRVEIPATKNDPERIETESEEKSITDLEQQIEELKTAKAELLTGESNKSEGKTMS